MLKNRCLSNCFGYCKLETSPDPQVLAISIASMGPCRYQWDTCAFFVSAIEEIRQERVQSKTEGMKSSS